MTWSRGLGGLDVGSLYIKSQISWLWEGTCCVLPFVSFARKLHPLIFWHHSFPHSFWLSPSPSHNRYCARPHSGVYTQCQHGKLRAWRQCLPTGSRNHLQQGVRRLLYHRGRELSSTMTSILVTSFWEMQIDLQLSLTLVAHLSGSQGVLI